MANNRSNNGRITPDSVLDNKIEVAATPVDKQQTFRPDLTSAQKSKALFDGLAVLGKGGIDVSYTIKDKADEQIFTAYKKTAEKNRQQWAEVSKNIKGMAKFNPYNKDAYNQILSVEQYRKVYNDVLATPDLSKRSPQEIDSLIESKHQEAMQGLQQLGVPDRAYAQYQIDFDNKMSQLKHNYVQAHAEEEYKVYKNTQSNEFAANLYNKYASNPKANKIEILQSSLSDLISSLDMTGTPNQTKAEVITNGITKLLSLDASMFNSGDIENALRQIDFGNGQRFEDLTEHGYADIKQIVRAAKEAHFSDQKLEYEQDQFNRQVTADKAMDEMMNFIIKNPKASGLMMKNQAQSLIQKYGVQGTQMLQFMNHIANAEKTWAEFSDVASNPEIKNYLYKKAIDGTLSSSELGQHVGSDISTQDAINLYGMINKEQEKEQAAGDKYVANHIKNAQKEMIGGKNDYMCPLYGDTQAQSEFNKRLAAINQEFKTNCKTLGVEQARIIANNSISNLKMNCKNYKQLKAQESQIKNTMSGVQARTNKYVSNINSGTAARNYSFNQFTPNMRKQYGNDLIRLNFVQGGTLTGIPNKNRVINGKKAPHYGWDVAAVGGLPVYAKGTGIVTASGYNNSEGYYCIVTYANGTQMRAMHFQQGSVPKTGTVLKPNSVIGRVGSTGHSTGNHVHFEFYKNGKNINPYVGILN